MSITQPIRDRELLDSLKDYYKTRKPNIRNYTLIILGLNSALRITDILHLTWGDVVDGNNRVRKHMVVRERKTGKENRILLNKEIRRSLEHYYKEIKRTSGQPAPGAFLFPSPLKKDAPLSRYQAYRLIKGAAEQVGLTDHISCHSLRKTFGYHAWKNGVQPALIMSIYNHSSYRVTVRYLCIEQDDRDEVFERIRL